MTFDALRPAARRAIQPVAIKIADSGISPNMMSLTSLIVAVLAGVCFYYTPTVPYLAAFALVLVALNSAFDALDGEMARHLRIDGKKGDFLDHVIDRYADTFIICGMFAGGHVPWQAGTITIIGVLLTSYLGTQAQALGIGRFYGGIMGRADRLILIMVSALFYTFYSGVLFGYSIIGWAVIIIGIASHITALQRIRNIWLRLE